uniref:EF-hand domain-containing protein n=1 Tax=Mucochytrium quahogii TaxID=96639 RepID=A0A7S2SF19_9STRA
MYCQWGGLWRPAGAGMHLRARAMPGGGRPGLNGIRNYWMLRGRLVPRLGRGTTVTKREASRQQVLIEQQFGGAWNVHARNCSNKAGSVDNGSNRVENDNSMKQLAEYLDEYPDLTLDLVKALPHNAKLRIANAILDQETLDGRTYGDYLASRHRRAIMVREISISVGEDITKRIGNPDLNNDGIVSNQELDTWLKNLVKMQEKKTTARAEPTRKQLWQLFLLAGVPFIGFGFLDNAIMLVAGDIIDTTLGRWLGISTLAAAGFGNIFSDVAGLGFGGYIEASAKSLGLKDPKLSLQQLNTRKVRILQFLATSIGITIGCLLGMVPLWFMDPDANEHKAMYENMRKSPGDKVYPSDLLNMFQNNVSIMSDENRKMMEDRVVNVFGARMNEELSYDDFLHFLQEVKDQKVVGGMTQEQHFVSQFCETVAC